jgi:hypothetical protein
MCKSKPAKSFRAIEGDMVYTGATEEAVFCSLRCAANWALLWVMDLDEPTW